MHLVVTSPWHSGHALDFLSRLAGSIPAGEKLKFSRRFFGKAQPWCDYGARLSSFLSYCSTVSPYSRMRIRTRLYYIPYNTSCLTTTAAAVPGDYTKNSPTERTGYPGAQRLKYRTYHSTPYRKIAR